MNKIVKNRVSIAIPVLNEEVNLPKCLEKIFSQNYQKNLVEVIIVDAGSTDKTLEIAKKFKTKILYNKIMKDPESGKMVALKKATGEYFMYLDADMFLHNKNWLNLMMAPFKDKRVSGTFTKFIVRKEDKALNRYLSYDPLQRDPLYQFLTPGIESLIVSKEKDLTIWKHNHEDCTLKVIIIEDIRFDLLMILLSLSSIIFKSHTLFNWKTSYMRLAL